jgi:hypothetical protein
MDTRSTALAAVSDPAQPCRLRLLVTEPDIGTLIVRDGRADRAWL